MTPSPIGLGWLAILRLGLVQTALGAVAVLTTSTLNRVMVVELGLLAIVPGALVGLHYGVQLSRPAWGHLADRGKGRTPWIIGGVALMGTASVGAAVSTFLLDGGWQGIAVAALFYALIGFGVGAAGTSLLALLASRTAPARRPAAAALVWMMMIAGIVATGITAGVHLDPFTKERLVAVTAATAAIALVLSILGVWGIERRAATAPEHRAEVPLRAALREVWADDEARLFTVFVLVSMFAYSFQDLILEPFGGLLFAMTPGETTKLGGMQHAGVLGGMIAAALLGSAFGKGRPRVMRALIVGGCAGSGLALAGLALGALMAPGWPLTLNVILLGLGNGCFAVAAIGTMMMLAGKGRDAREGTRMGVWGAAQAIGFGAGGLSGTAAIDLARAHLGDATAFAAVFALEAALFAAAALIATRLAVNTVAVQGGTRPRPAPIVLQPAE